MNYFDEKVTEDEISFDDENNQKQIEKQMYQNYLRKENLIDTKNEIVNKQAEMFIKDKNLYLAMKQLPDLERKVFVLSVISNKKLDDICKMLKISKNQVLKLKKKSTKHFIRNLKSVSKNNSKAGKK